MKIKHIIEILKGCQDMVDYGSPETAIKGYMDIACRCYDTEWIRNVAADFGYPHLIKYIDEVHYGKSI